MNYKNKKGIVKLVIFAIIMIILSSGLGVMLLAQNTVGDITEDFYESGAVSNETIIRIQTNTNPVDFRDYNSEINIVILCILIIFFSYALISSYLNSVNNIKGVLNFFLLIILLAITNYLLKVDTYIWSMPMFSGIELEYWALEFYFDNIGKIHLIIGILISVLTVAPKSEKQKIEVGRFG